MPAISRIW